MINFFISSTFKDFREERSILNNEILPTFREQARAHGESMSTVDMSWGINNFNLSEEESAKLVLSVCLNAVDKCRPFLIAMIGQRRGYEVTEKNWIPEEFDKEIPDALGKGITELEIIHALRDKCDAIICIRKIEDNFPDAETRKKYIDDDPALEEFKRQLYKHHGEKILEYRATWLGDKLGDFRTLDGKNFFDVLQEKMLTCCQPYWQEKQSRQDREKNFTEQIISERAESFFGREKLLSSIRTQLAENKNVHIFGESGCGKTSLMCKIATDLRKENKHVITLLAGSSLYNNSQFWLEQMVYLLEESLSEPHANFLPSAEEWETDFYNKWKLRLSELCGKTREPIYFIIDGIDQLEETDPHRNKIDFLPTTTKNTHCLVSYTSDFKKNLQVNARDFQSREIPLLDVKNIKLVLEKILKRYEKDLFPKTAAAVKEKKSAKNFLFLQMCARYLLMISARELTTLKSPQDIVDMTVERIGDVPDSVEDAAWFIIEQAAEKLCKNPQAALDAIKLIAASRTGLRIFDLQEILGFDNLLTLDFWRLRKYLHDEFFIDRPNGCIDFAHQIIRKAVSDKLKAENLLDTCENLIANYLEKLPEKDPLRCSEGFFFAQKKSMFDFGAKLLHEATNNFAMLHEIRNALLSDGGNFGNKLVKNYMTNNVAILKLLGNLSFIMTESAKDYEIFLNLLSSIQIDQDSRKIHYCEIEILKALQELRLNNLTTAKMHLLNVINFGEEEAKKNSHAYSDSRFCGRITLSYNILTLIKLNSDNKQTLLRYEEKNVEWALHTLNLSRSKSSILSFAMANYSLALHRMKYKLRPLKEILKDVLVSYDLLRDLHENEKAYVPYLRALTAVCNRIAEINFLLDDNTAAFLFAGEAENYATLLLSLDRNNLDSIMTAGMAKMDLAVMEFNLLMDKPKKEISYENILEIRKHEDEGYNLIMEYNQRVSNKYGRQVLNNAKRFRKGLYYFVKDFIMP